MFPLAAFLVRMQRTYGNSTPSGFSSQASRSQSLDPYLAFKGADLAFWRHLSLFQEAVHPSYPEYERRHPNVIPPFSCCFYLGISISAVFFITLRQLVRFAVQMMLDAEVTAYPHERKQPYIN